VIINNLKINPPIKKIKINTTVQMTKGVFGLEGVESGKLRVSGSGSVKKV